jgi:hypothetical protein
MASKLSTKYFKIRRTEYDSGFKYSIIEPLLNPMILFSKVTGQALASLHFLPKDETSKSKTLISKRLDNSGVNFQCLIDTDNQKIKFVITCLNDYNINFDILKENGINVNASNCFGPYESTEILADSSNDSTEFILGTIEKSPPKKGKHSEKMTVKEAETGSTDKGAYYYLSVAPQDEDELVSQFKDTIWACVDLFVIREKDNRPVHRPYGHSSLDGSSHRPSLRNEAMSHDEMPQMSESNDEENGMNQVFELFDNLFEEEEETDIGSSFEGDEPELSPFRLSSSQPQPQLQPQPQPQPQPQLPYNERKTNDTELINSSYIGTINRGDKVDVRTVQCDLRFNYDVMSLGCKIGLSVSPNMVFVSICDDKKTEKKINELFDNIIRIGLDFILKEITRVYESTDCVICLDRMSDRTKLIFYQCGHKSCHYDCGKGLDICPICRASVKAHIKV